MGSDAFVDESRAFTDGDDLEIGDRTHVLDDVLESFEVGGLIPGCAFRRDNHDGAAVFLLEGGKSEVGDQFVRLLTRELRIRIDKESRGCETYSSGDIIPRRGYAEDYFFGKGPSRRLGGK